MDKCDFIIITCIIIMPILNHKTVTPLQLLLQNMGIKRRMLSENGSVYYNRQSIKRKNILHDCTG